MQDEIKALIKELERVANFRYGRMAYPWMAGVLSSIMTMFDNQKDQIRGIRNVLDDLERNPVPG